MTIIVLTAVPQQLRGYVTRFLIEIYTGLYVGKCSRRVSDALWERCKVEVGSGVAVIIRTVNNEQGFMIDAIGLHNRKVVDVDGLQFIARKPDEVVHESENASEGSNQHWSKAYWRRRRR